MWGIEVKLGDEVILDGFAKTEEAAQAMANRYVLYTIVSRWPDQKPVSRVWKRH